MKIRIAAGLSALLLLSGCFNMKHELLIRADGTARQVSTNSVDVRDFDAASLEKLDELCANRTAGGLPDGISARVEQRKEGSEFTCTVTMEGATEQFLAFISDQENAASGGGQPLRHLSMKLSKEGEHRRLDVSTAPPSNMSAQEKRLRREFADGAIGRNFEFSVTAPRIIETTGTLSKDGKTATYSLPMARILTNETETFHFSVAFLDKAPE